MKNLWKIIIVLILASSVIAVVMLKNAENRDKPNLPAEKSVESNNNPLVTTIEVTEQAAAGAVEAKKLPRLVDLGADKCIPCKMMKPVLDELEKEYKGKLQVEFYDVWKNPASGRQYNIRVIPTQIFIDPEGKELFRHEGFYSKEDILAKWKEFGFDLK